MRTLLFVCCLTFNFFMVSGQAQVNPKAAKVNGLINDADLNIYGQVARARLLDTTWFAKNVVSAVKSQRLREYASWFFLNSFWQAEEGQSMYKYGDYQNPLWKHNWHRYEKGAPTKKDMKSLLEFANAYLVHEVNGGPGLSEIYSSNSCSNTSGTVFLSLALMQLEWPHEIRSYKDHLFIVFPNGDEHLILDCSQATKLWKVSDRKSAYLDYLISKDFIRAGEMNLQQLVEKSERISCNQLVALQKMAEADGLTESNPAAAFYRMEVAHFFWPVPKVKERWIAASKNLYQSGTAKNDWHKVYGMLTYMRLTGDRSEQIKEDFNVALGLAFEYYYEHEEVTMGYPVSMSIRRADSYFSDEVLQKDTMNLLAAFAYNSYVGFELFDPALRGLFHSLSFENAVERSSTDYQFYMDALYVYAYLDASDEFLSAIYHVNLNKYRHIDDLPNLLKDHYKHGALTESAYHEMSVIFYLSYLDQNAPDNVDEANKVNKSSLVYSLYQEALPKHLVFVENPFLRNKAREYVKRMEPIYADKFISDYKNLEQIAEICGVETNLDAYEKMSKAEQARDLIRRLELLEKD